MDNFNNFLVILSSISFNLPSVENIIEIIFFFLLIFSSALISGSEVGFFSLTPTILETFKNSKSKNDKKILDSLNEPDKLLATILIANNFVNIAIILITTKITTDVINFPDQKWIKFLIEVVFITFVLVLFGEITPKIYANRYKKSLIRMMVFPLSFLQKIFYPLVYILIKFTKVANKKIQGKNELSMKDLSFAIDMTSDSTKNEKKILKSVVNISNIEVREIMTPRVDVITLNSSFKLSVVKSIIADACFSRIPVYEDELDNIIGVLYIKDLIKFLNKDNYFNWQSFIRPAYFVPENKKVDDLLQEFRTKKIHLAIVSDEYGGFSGIVTLEDTIEEIVGEINDEYDIPDNLFEKISEFQYVVDGKLLLNDFQRLLNVNYSFFDENKGDAETVAGLILEIIGDFPNKNQLIKYKNIEFKIISINNRRIEKIDVKIQKK